MLSHYSCMSCFLLWSWNTRATHYSLLLQLNHHRSKAEAIKGHSHTQTLYSLNVDLFPLMCIRCFVVLTSSVTFFQKLKLGRMQLNCRQSHNQYEQKLIDYVSFVKRDFIWLEKNVINHERRLSSVAPTAVEHRCLLFLNITKYRNEEITIFSVGYFWCLENSVSVWKT